jgi:hypothetical protein
MILLSHGIVIFLCLHLLAGVVVNRWLGGDGMCCFRLRCVAAHYRGHLLYTRVEFVGSIWRNLFGFRKLQ